MTIAHALPYYAHDSRTNVTDASGRQLGRPLPLIGSSQAGGCCGEPQAAGWVYTPILGPTSFPTQHAERSANLAATSSHEM